jgi:hypothetical protein
MNRTKLDLVFKTTTPVLPNVKITDVWGYYDGPLSGICEINGQSFYFMDVIFDVWRFYKDDTHQRLWSIFAVYDISIEEARSVVKGSRTGWQAEIEDVSDCIGIFWEYENTSSL